MGNITDPMPDELWSSHEVEFLADISFKQLDSMNRAGVLPAAVEASGAGGPDRMFTREQANLARLMGILARMGAQLARLRAVKEELDRRPELWGETVIVTGDRFGHDPGEILRARSASADGWLVNLAAVQAYVFERRRELLARREGQEPEVVAPEPEPVPEPTKPKGRKRSR